MVLNIDNPLEFDIAIDQVLLIQFFHQSLNEAKVRAKQDDKLIYEEHLHYDIFTFLLINTILIVEHFFHAWSGVKHWRD